jgi:hypothetical protein
MNQLDHPEVEELLGVVGKEFISLRRRKDSKARDHCLPMWGWKELLVGFVLGFVVFLVGRNNLVRTV